MLRRRIGTHGTTTPLRCNRCQHLGLNPQVTVGPGIVERRLREGRHRDHVSVSCSNGHSWWSIHPEALKQGRPADKLAALSFSRIDECTSPLAG
jgi:hypothetical protein